MDEKEKILELKEKFDKIIQKYKFNSRTKTQELVDYIISKDKHDAQDLAKYFSIDVNEAIILLTFFQKGIEFKKEVDEQKSK